MWLDELRVQAFLGITRPLSLDLRAGLTVLHAPNGSGKTSVCQAIEWLLTGRAPQRGVRTVASVPELACRFTPGLATEVGGTLRLGDQTLALLRDMEGLHLQKGGENTDKWLLGRLAPQVATSESRTEQTNRQRRSWLQDSRFLSGSGLSILLDDDPDTASRRQALFARLLGVAELNHESRLLEGFQARGPSLRTLDDQLQRAQQAEEAALQRWQQALHDLQHGHDAQASALLDEAATLLSSSPHPEEDDPAPLADRLSLLRTAAAQTEHELERRRAALGELQKHWGERQQLPAREATLRTLTDALLKDANTLQQQAQTQREAQRARRAQAQRAIAQATDLARRREALAHLLPADEPTPMPPNLSLDPEEPKFADLLHQETRALKGPQERLGDALELLIAARHQLDDRLADRALLDACRQEAGALTDNLPSPTEVQALRLRLVDLQSRRVTLRQRIQSAQDPWQHLQQVATDLLRSLPEQEACPLCGHHWPHPQALRDALEATRGQTPAPLRRMERTLLSLEAQLAALTEQVADAAAGRERLADSRSRLQELEGRWQPFARQLRALGLDPDSSELPQALEDHRQRVATEATHLLARILGLEQAADAARDLLQERGRSTAAELQALENHLLNTQERLQTARRDLSAVRALYGELKAYWDLLAPGEPLGARPLQELAPPIASQRQRLTRAQALLDTAERWLKMESAAKELQEIHRLALQRRQQAEGRLAHWRSVRDTTHSALRRLDQEIHARMEASLRPIQRAVSAIYQRTQVNPVFDTIRMLGGHEGDSAPHWRAMAGDLEFGTRELSQGQRVDLALAIFLARARSLEGTFILDEPLAHLDDWNKVAVLDLLRVLVLESQGSMRLLLTTASRRLVRHLQEKFHAVPWRQGQPPLRCYELRGNPREGASLAPPQDAGLSPVAP